MAQLAAQDICNVKVGGSTPSVGSMGYFPRLVSNFYPLGSVIVDSRIKTFQKIKQMTLRKDEMDPIFRVR